MNNNNNNIQVAIKLRPLISREKDDNLPIQWRVEGNTLIPINNSDTYTFDHIFDSNSNNIKVYETVVKPLVDAASKGFNATVFAYGQTSSGKTYTMMGNHSEPGVISLAVEQLFNIVKNSHNTEYLLRVSYLEIYNEKVIDLLEPERQVRIHEDITGNVFTTVKEEIVKSDRELFRIKKRGDKYRRFGETNMNDRSSRSHAIFKIIIESSKDTRNIVQVSHLNLVDLAGSERASQTGATGIRLKEGQHINKSLSTLSFVIRQLSESQDQNRFINFRDSKLTRILQSSLGGNAKTAIICTITPISLEETQSTLAFALQAKSVKNKPKVNGVVTDEALLKRYAIQVQKLKLELCKTQQDNKNLQENHFQIAMHNKMLKERIALLEKPVLRGSMDQQNRRMTWCGNPTRNVSSSNLLLEKDDYDIWDCMPLEEFERELIDAERSKLCVIVEGEDSSSVSSENTDIFSLKEMEIVSKLQILEQEYESLKIFQKEEYNLLKEENNSLVEKNENLQFELKQIINLLYAVMQQPHSNTSNVCDISTYSDFKEDSILNVNMQLKTCLPEYEEIRRRLIYLNTLTDKYNTIKKQYNVLRYYVLQLQNKKTDIFNTSISYSDDSFDSKEIIENNDISTLFSEIMTDIKLLYSFVQHKTDNELEQDTTFCVSSTEITKLNNSKENLSTSALKSEGHIRDHVKNRRKSQRHSLLESLRGISESTTQEYNSLNSIESIYCDKEKEMQINAVEQKSTSVNTNTVFLKNYGTQTLDLRINKKDVEVSTYVTLQEREMQTNAVEQKSASVNTNTVFFKNYGTQTIDLRINKKDVEVSTDVILQEREMQKNTVEQKSTSVNTNRVFLKNYGTQTVDLRINKKDVEISTDVILQEREMQTNAVEQKSISVNTNRVFLKNNGTQTVDLRINKKDVEVSTDVILQEREMQRNTVEKKSTLANTNNRVLLKDSIVGVRGEQQNISLNTDPVNCKENETQTEINVEKRNVLVNTDPIDWKCLDGTIFTNVSTNTENCQYEEQFEKLKIEIQSLKTELKTKTDNLLILQFKFKKMANELVSVKNSNKENENSDKQQNKLEIIQEQSKVKRRNFLDVKRGLRSSAEHYIDVGTNTDSNDFYRQLCLRNAKIVELQQELKMSREQVSKLITLNEKLYLERSEYVKKIESLTVKLSQKETVKKNVATNTEEIIKQKLDLPSNFLKNIPSGIVALKDLESYCFQLENKLQAYKKLCKIREAEKHELEMQLSLIKRNKC